MAMDFPSSPTDGQASNGYTWNAAKGAWVGGPGTRYTQAEADAKFVDVGGDTMTGHLFLPTGPAAANAIRKDYVDAADATNAASAAAKLPLAGGTLSGALNGTSLRMSGELKTDVGIIRFNAADTAYLYWNGSVYSLGGAGTIWHTGNFNPASYAPIGGVGGNWVVGSSTHGTDGNIYMPWAGDWLSNVFGRYAPLGGVPNNFSCVILTASSQGQFTGVLYSTWAGANTTTNSANCQIGSNGTFQRSTSSIRYKTAIEPLQDAWADKVMQLEPIYYTPMNTIDPKGYTRYGFAAEQCYAVDPRFSSCEPQTFVGRDDEQKEMYEDGLNIIGLDLNAIVAALQQVIKRQDARIAALEAA